MSQADPQHAPQAHPRSTTAAPPARDLIASGAPSASLNDAAQAVRAAFKDRGFALKPLPKPRDPELRDVLRLASTRLPDPLTHPDAEYDAVVATVFGPWDDARTDAFIASMAPLRTGPGLPRFLIYATHTLPPEVEFLFATASAGLLEMSAWDVVDDQNINSLDCPDLAEAGRSLLSDLYHVRLDPLDLQWLSVVNQLIVEELRWFTDDPDTSIPASIDYLPFAALTLLGCVAGEAIRLNHADTLVWADADGNNWPRLGHPGSNVALHILDATFKRFESGADHDLWEGYQRYYTSERLDPPRSFHLDAHTALDFLPNWDPAPGASLDQARATFERVCADSGLDLIDHPIAPAGDAAEALDGFLVAYTCDVEGQTYDLFVSTEGWTEATAAAFLRTYGHRSLSDWEIGMSPIFVFFSGHTLDPVLEYCFIAGPPIAPLEGLARVETPSPNIPDQPDVAETLAYWLLDAMESYTTIGLDLGEPSVLPGLEFLVREELASGDAVFEDDDLDPADVPLFEPLALLITIGLTAGASFARRCDASAQCAWSFDGSDATSGPSWPVMTWRTGDQTHTFDWVEAARRIWRGDADEFGAPTPA